MTGEQRVSGAQAGSIRHVVDHLVMWLGHRRPGIAWVEFGSDAARDSAIQQIDAAFMPRGSTTRLTVEHATGRVDWEDLRCRLDATEGIVHVAFSRVLLLPVVPPRDIRQFGLSLNLDRERVFSMGSQQIWWVPVEFGQQLRVWAPDFLSWVNLRLSLEEIPPSARPVDSNSVGLSLQYADEEHRTRVENEITPPPVLPMPPIPTLLRRLIYSGDRSS